MNKGNIEECKKCAHQLLTKLKERVEAYFYSIYTPYALIIFMFLARIPVTTNKYDPYKSFFMLHEWDYLILSIFIFAYLFIHIIDKGFLKAHNSSYYEKKRERHFWINFGVLSFVGFYPQVWFFLQKNSISIIFLGWYFLYIGTYVAIFKILPVLIEKIGKRNEPLHSPNFISAAGVFTNFLSAFIAIGVLAPTVLLLSPEPKFFIPMIAKISKLNNPEAVSDLVKELLEEYFLLLMGNIFEFLRTFAVVIFIKRENIKN